MMQSIEVENLQKLEQLQAKLRMEQYKKYENALENFEKQLEGLESRTEKSMTFFTKMFESFIKKTKTTTEEINNIKTSVESATSDMVQALTLLENGLEDCNKKLAKQLKGVLHDLERKCQKNEDMDNVELVDAIGNIVKMIHTYAT
ncbi:uncharacterized protein LOC118436642 [Folsomia candida]|uniref:Uncharacterized protein n=1 Tax=Folsomia candida TaxID=158441 RepID=A0A226DZ97_FOLCA|nr:uncharacterized protein LOC118436642 [Folsomia candida]OXA50370.1 hypothetical protein Fcan01_14746 [Folsomia candida]